MPRDADDAAVQATGLRHKLWLPQPATAPLYLLAHGRAGDRGAMWAFGSCVPGVANILAPEAFLEDRDDGGFCWWPKGKPNVEAIERASDRLTQFVRASIEHYALQPHQIVAIGFSQGAALLSVLLQDSPGLFAGVALLAGFVIDRPAQSNSPPTRVFLGHGLRDSIVPIAQAKAGATLLTERSYEVELHVDDVAHKVGRTVTRELKSWAARISAVTER